MRAPSEHEEVWDFYPCMVDERPASIFLDLGYEGARPPVATNTLYAMRVQMADAAAHGMGSGHEAEVLFACEDAITARAAGLGLLFVGRVRNSGSWQVTWYGPEGREAALTALGQAPGLRGRPFEIVSRLDAEWSYYREFLLPGPERRQWMQDRRVVEVLEAEGDDHAIPRRVDHWVYFSSSLARQAFIEDLMPEGFALEGTPDHAGVFGAQVFRTDAVELPHIHAVVMRIVELAARRGGDYDGWECPVERPRLT